MLLDEKNQDPPRIIFNSVADHYDRWYQTPLGMMYDRLEKKAFDRLLVIGNYGRQSLLEIGCGTGHWSKYFRDRGFLVTGVDISREMIWIAGKKNIAGCRFLVAEGESLPFADNSFDAAGAVATLEFTPDPSQIVAEMVRCVKKPGGRLLFGLLNRLSRYNQKRKERSGSIFAGANLFSPAQLRDLLVPLGKVKILVVGFVPTRKHWIWLAPFWDYLCRLAGRQKGAFLAAEVTL
jgi:SAM-dependent methyltransferase